MQFPYPAKSERIGACGSSDIKTFLPITVMPLRACARGYIYYDTRRELAAAEAA